MNNENTPFWRFILSLWHFFASVKLALFTFFILAIASIIGTIYPQNKEMADYIQLVGESWARVFQILDFQDMYGSWWFVTLLGLFCLNLVVCTIERLPNVWRIMVQDNFATEPSRLEKMGNRKTFQSTESLDNATNAAQEILSKSGWKTKQAQKNDSTLLFAQKGAWSRLGVYMVHISILVIFGGAIIGGFWGDKGSVMIAEGTSHDKMYRFDKTRSAVPLGFEVHCDFFTIDYYKSGQPKEFRSDLRVLENGKEVLSKRIEVNDPLDYKGFTFYQSSYQAIDNELIATIENNATKSRYMSLISPGKKAVLQEEGLTYGILNVNRSQNYGKYRFKIWFSDEKASPSVFWVEEETPIFVERPGAKYSFQIKQRYYTGLQVAKDPGVWTVYAGCTLMLVGLYVAFFLAHRRLWVLVTPAGKGTKVLISGMSNKNKYGFDKHIESLSEKFKETGKFTITP